MSENPLHVLKKNLQVAKLKDSFKERKDNLLACLDRKERISDEDKDKEWLDNAGNTVDEEAVLNLLENMSDYELSLAQLTAQQKILVEKLKELGGERKKNSLVRKQEKKLEGSILTSFGHQTCLESNRMMEMTHITDYFTRK